MGLRYFIYLTVQLGIHLNLNSLNTCTHSLLSCGIVLNFLGHVSAHIVLCKRPNPLTKKFDHCQEHRKHILFLIFFDEFHDYFLMHFYSDFREGLLDELFNKTSQNVVVADTVVGTKMLM